MTDLDATQDPGASGSTAAVTGAPATDPAPGPATDPTTRLFSRSIVISGTRCLLAYVVFPWVLPLLGIAKGVGPFIGIVISVVAIGFNVASIRRFWVARHRWRYAITALNVSVIALLTILLWIDVRDLL